jgi:FlaA1/EpsC-like NDP-sugar epimerase
VIRPPAVIRPGVKFIDFLLVCGSFLGALAIYNTLFRAGLGLYGMLAGSAISIGAFWVAIELRQSDRSENAASWWIIFIELFCVGTGANLVLHSLFIYAFFIRRTPLLISLGGLLAATLLTLHARWNARNKDAKKRFIALGFDEITRQVMEGIGQPLLGIVADTPAEAPCGVPWLGNFSELEEVLKTYRPTNIVVEMKQWSRRISPSLLLDCRRSGVGVEGAPQLYEKVFHRVCCQSLRPGGLDPFLKASNAPASSTSPSVC